MDNAEKVYENIVKSAKVAIKLRGDAEDIMKEEDRACGKLCRLLKKYTKSLFPESKPSITHCTYDVVEWWLHCGFIDRFDDLDNLSKSESKHFRWLKEITNNTSIWIDYCKEEWYER